MDPLTVPHLRFDKPQKVFGRANRFLVLVLLALFFCEAHAADDKRADRDARRIQLLEQRFDQQRSQWETEREDLQKKLADAQQSLNTLQSMNAKTAADLARAGRDHIALHQSIAKLTKQMETQQATNQKELDERATELANFMAARQQERLVLNGRNDTQTKELSICSEDNLRLLKIGHELLERYRDKGIIDALKQEEPFLGIGDTEMFNLVQDYREKIEPLKFSPESDQKPHGG